MKRATRAREPQSGVRLAVRGQEHETTIAGPGRQSRDTSRVMKDYVTAFDAPILALTGPPAAIAEAAKNYRVYYAKHPEAGGDYSMDHTSLIYVMDPKGRFTASFTGEDLPEQMAERLKKLLS